jgi:hypothetical protein
MIRSRHHEVWRMSSIHDSDVFQSSCTSWSSNSITVGTVECSQRSIGCDHAS